MTRSEFSAGTSARLAPVSATALSDARHGPAGLSSLSRRDPAPRRRTISVAVGQRPALQLEALSRQLQAAEAFELRCAATTCELLTRLVARRPPDLALVHAALDPGAPLGFVVALRQVAPHMAIVVLVDELNPALAHAALMEQVDGVVLGDSSISDLVAVLERVADGESVFPGGWLSAARRADSESVEGLLSDRQQDVLELLAAGLGNRAIADQLQISPNTVKFHVRQIYQRLGVTNRVEATLLLQAESAPARHPYRRRTPSLPERVGTPHPGGASQTTRRPVSRAGVLT